MTCPEVEVAGAAKHFRTESGSSIHALGPLDMEIGEGEFVCVLGPTGCGKTTLLRLLAGLEKPDAGIVRVQGKPPVPGNGTGFVFQRPALFPWLRVGANVGFGLSCCGFGRSRGRERVEALLGSVGMIDWIGSFPHELSGGMQQRVALARSLASSPGLLLLDEPFGALDTVTRQEIQDLLLGLCADAGVTVVFVTHSIEEAVYLGTRLIVMGHRPGRIVTELEMPMPHPRDRLSRAYVDMLLDVRAVFEGLVDEERHSRSPVETPDRITG